MHSIVKNAARALMLTLALGLLTACASSEYIISTNDGTMITTQGKPKLDEKSGMYSYEDAQGRKATIAKDKVKQIMER